MGVDQPGTDARPGSRRRQRGRIRGAILTAGVLALAGHGAALEPAQRPQDVVGRAEFVADGDTLAVAATLIRLQGIAAPEIEQPGGRQSRAALIRLVQGRRLHCRLTGERSYNRWIGTCRREDGADLGAAMVAGGHARDCARYSDGRYADLEPRGARRLPLPGYCRPGLRSDPEPLPARR
jgi:endonuclease YncB( thermonuclease family)